MLRLWRWKVVKLMVVLLGVWHLLGALAFDAQILAWIFPIQWGSHVDAKVWTKAVEIPEGHRDLRFHVVGGIWTTEEGFELGRDLVRAMLARCLVGHEGGHWAFEKAYIPETVSFWADGRRAAKGLVGGRFGIFPPEDSRLAYQIREAINRDLADGYDVIVIAISYGVVFSGLALFDSPEHVGVLTLGSPADLSNLKIPYRGVCVGADPVCALQGPSLVSFGVMGQPTKGARGLVHHPMYYLHPSWGQGSVMKALTSLLGEMGCVVKNKGV